MDRGNDNLVGIWKLVSVVVRPASGREAVNAMGENPSGFLTYTVGMHRITHQVEVSWLENWVGTDRIRFVRLEGDLLTLSSPPTPMGGRQVVAELVWTRLG